MALATNVLSTQKIKVYVGTEATFGTATLTGGTWDEVDVTDYSLPVASPAVDTAPMRTGVAVEMSNQNTTRQDQAMYTFDLTMRATAASLGIAFAAWCEDGSSPHTLTGNSIQAPVSDGDTYALGKTILFKSAGADATNVNLYCTSCLCTDIEITQDAGSDGGQGTVKTTWMTAYKPVEGTLVPTSATQDTATPFNFKDITAATVYPAGGSSLNVLPFKWSLKCSRTLQRVSFKDTTDYKPYHIVQDGPYSVTGALTVRRDTNVGSLLPTFLDPASKNQTIFTITGSPLVVVVRGEVEPTSIDKGGPTLMQEIPFKMTSASGSESTVILSVTTS